jgi:hypothetical protein
VGPVRIHPALPNSAALQDFLTYWAGKRPGHLPQRGDFDPLVERPRMAPSMFLVDVLDEGAVFRFRLVGTRITRFVGTDLTGIYTHYDPYAMTTSATARSFELAVRHRKPIFVRADCWWSGDAHGRTETIVAPLVDERGVVTMLFGFNVFIDPPVSLRNLEIRIGESEIYVLEDALDPPMAEQPPLEAEVA